MKQVLLALALGWLGFGCRTVPPADMSLHPDSTGVGWSDVFSATLDNATCAEPGWAWQTDGFLVPGTKETLLTKKDYSDFVLDVEYVMEPTCNSGIFLYDVDHPTNKFEVQILDDFHPMYKDEVPYQNTGAIYGRLAPRHVASNDPGEINRMTCWCLGPSVRIVLNGVEIVNTDLNDWQDPLINPDGTKVPWFHVGYPALSKIPRHGRIGLQGIHGGTAVRFRFLRVKEFKR